MQEERWGETTDHVAEMAPLVQEVAVDIDAVGLAQVFGDEGPDGGQVLGFEGVFILDVLELAGELCPGRWRGLIHILVK